MCGAPRSAKGGWVIPIFVMLQALVTSSIAFSDEVAVSFTGVITGHSDTFCQCLVGVENGDPVTGYYIYDAQSVDVEPDPHVGVYPDSLPPSFILVRAGEHRFMSRPGGNAFFISVMDSTLDSYGYFDGYVVHEDDAVDNAWHIDVWDIDIRFRDNSTVAVDSDSLLLKAPDINDWQTQRNFLLVGSGWRIDGYITFMTDGILVGVDDGRVPEAGLRGLRASPNPFGTEVSVIFTLESEADVSLSLYNVAGEELRRENLGLKPAGPHAYLLRDVDSNNNPLPSGVYFCAIRAGSSSSTIKIVLTK